MKKTIIALAVAGLSFNAFAVDLANNTGTTVFVKEANIAGVTIGDSAALEVTTPAGFALNQHFVRFDLTNGAKFAEDPELADESTANTYTVASGGKGESFVIFNSGDSAEIGKEDILTLDAKLTVANKNAVNVAYSIYENAGNAVGEAGALSKKSGTLLRFADALDVTAKNSVGTENIDVGTESKLFVGDLTETDFADLKVALVDTPPRLLDNSAAVSLADILEGNGSLWTLEGDFSFIEGLDGFDIAEDKQSAVLADDAIASLTDSDIELSVDGETVMSEGAYTAIFTPVANTGYVVDTVTLKDAIKLSKNGSHAFVNLALKPGGAFSNYVRISNTTNIDGKVFVTVTNDAGDAVTFPLSAIDGQPAELAKQSSTEQMTIEQVFAAAQAQGLALTGQGKLRLKVEGEFTSGEQNGVSVQTYTLAKDGNSFATFN